MPLDPERIRHLLELQHRTDLFEAVIRRVYECVLEPGDCAVDGGANHGLHSFTLAERVGRGGLVHAFEPIPWLAARLRLIVERHDYPQVVVHQEALSNADGPHSFEFVTNAEAYSGLRPRDYPGFAPEIRQITVERRRLDSISAERLERWRFCKLDLEGGEYDALCGGEAMLGRYGPLIAMENGRAASAGFYGYAAEDWFGLLDRLGYEQFDLYGRPFGPGAWSDPDVPWYCFAARRFSRDLAFIRDRLPGIVDEIAALAETSDSLATLWRRVGELQRAPAG
jgi:FkbM family methyltransferase